MKYLITGGCGFLGTNIAHEILKKSEDLVVFDSLDRLGSDQNLKWLKSKGVFEFIRGNIRNKNEIEGAIKKYQPDVIYHLAGQVAMTTSIASPEIDFEINAGGSFNLLNAVRQYSPQSIVVYSSTNKVYGDLEQYSYCEKSTRYECVEKPRGFAEDTPLNFHSPYGVSKGSADQYMLDFARIYSLNTVVFRHSSMFGGRQFSTFDQGWVGWFVGKALEKRLNINTNPFTIAGNGKQVRDLLFASDVTALYLKVPDCIDQIRGEAFNIGGGIENSCSLLELFALLEDVLGVKMEYTGLPPRESDQKFFVADIEKVKKRIGWYPVANKMDAINRTVDWAREQRLV